MPLTTETTFEKGDRCIAEKRVTILRAGPTVAWVEDDSGQQFYVRLSELRASGSPGTTA